MFESAECTAAEGIWTLVRAGGGLVLRWGRQRCGVHRDGSWECEGEREGGGLEGRNISTHVGGGGGGHTVSRWS